MKQSFAFCPFFFFFFVCVRISNVPRVCLTYIPVNAPSVSLDG